MPQFRENSSFPASLGFYTSRSGPGRSALPTLGDAFERCPQSGEIFFSVNSSPDIRIVDNEVQLNFQVFRLGEQRGESLVILTIDRTKTGTNTILCLVSY